MFTVELKADQVTGALERLSDSMDDMTDVMNDIGDYLTRATKDRFADGNGPDGAAWAANSPVTLARKSSVKPLVQSGTMQEGIFHDAGRDFVEVGSGVVQAGMMQFGGTRAAFPHLWGDIPARPFLGVSPEYETNMLALIEDYLTKAVGPAS